MFTPEFASTERGEFVLVANHSLESAAAVAMSVEYNVARIRFGLGEVPSSLKKCRLVYDVRGQQLAEGVLEQVRAELQSLCELEFKL